MKRWKSAGEFARSIEYSQMSDLRTGPSELKDHDEHGVVEELSPQITVRTADAKIETERK